MFGSPFLHWRLWRLLKHLTWRFWSFDGFVKTKKFSLFFVKYNYYWSNHGCLLPFALGVPHTSIFRCRTFSLDFCNSELCSVFGVRCSAVRLLIHFFRDTICSMTNILEQIKYVYIFTCETVLVDLENSTGVVFLCAWINLVRLVRCTFTRLPFKFMTETTPLSFPNSHRLKYIMSVWICDVNCMAYSGYTVLEPNQSVLNS